MQAAETVQTQYRKVGYDNERIIRPYKRIIQRTTNFSQSIGKGKQDRTLKLYSHTAAAVSKHFEVVNGNEADVVTLALEYDVKAIQDGGLIEDGWINEFDKDSSPYTSTIVFLCKKRQSEKYQGLGRPC